MWDDYQKEQDNITAPDHLKVKTLQHMLDVQNRKKKFTPKLTLAIASSFTIVIVAIFYWMNAANYPLMTQINFEQLDGAPRHFGNINEDSKTLTLEEVKTQLNINISSLTLESFQLNEIIWQQENDHLRIRYHFEDQDITLRITVDNKAEVANYNSTINDLPLGLYYWMMLTQTTYIAEFINHNLYYQIEITGVSEETFLNHLQKIITFIN